MKILVRLWLLSACMGVSLTAQAACDPADMSIEIVQSSWHNRCSKKNCAELQGSAVLISRCDEPVAVRVRLTAIDANGKPVKKLDRWPYALSNVTAGEHEFSLDKWFKHDPGIRGFNIEVIKIRPVNQ